jgi:hypothetical protein
MKFQDYGAAEFALVGCGAVAPTTPCERLLGGTYRYMNLLLLIR